MAILRRRPPLPDDLHRAWGAFLDCAQAIEAGRRVLLGTLPTGRVEPAPVALGVTALEQSLQDVRGWMPAWRLPEVDEDWTDCLAAVDEAEAELVTLRRVAAETSELEDLLGAVTGVVAPLDAFADAERTWRRTWRLPRGHPAG